MKIFANPLVEINGIKFGMKKTDVRKLLGAATEFQKTPISLNLTDDFGYCHVFYDEKDECEAIEFFVGNEISVNGTTIFPSTISCLEKLFPDLQKSEDCYISFSYSIAIYAPNEKMESITFGKKNYYY